MMEHEPSHNHRDLVFVLLVPFGLDLQKGRSMVMSRCLAIRGHMSLLPDLDFSAAFLRKSDFPLIFKLGRRKGVHKDQTAHFGHPVSSIPGKE
jgi:hypothetical protein